MWNEVYAPTTQAELVWSRQKQDALLGHLRGSATGSQKPRALLLYGPPGCAKLSSLCVLVHQVASELAKLEHSASASSSVAAATGAQQEMSSSNGAATPSSSSSPSTTSSRAASTTGRGRTSGASRQSQKPRTTATTRASAGGETDTSPTPRLSEAVTRGLNTSTEFTATVDNLRLHVYHTCDNTLQRYSQLLRSILLELVENTAQPRHTGSTAASDAAANGALHTESLLMSSSLSVPTESTAAATPSAVTFTAHVIKFYGESAGDALHRYTTAFMHQYEQLLVSAAHAAASASAGGGNDQRGTLFHNFAQRQRRDASADTASMLLRRLQRHAIVFIHTTHDTHNDKVDLGRALPSTLLQSSACEMFHCTPITAINMTRRVMCVLEHEVENQRWRAEQDRAPNAESRLVAARTVSTSPSPRKAASIVDIDVDAEDEVEQSVSTTVGPARRGRTDTAARMRTAAGAKRPRSRTRGQVRDAAASSRLSAGDLEAIIAAGQGDVRQTLLQVQWAALVPSSSVDAATQDASAATAGLDRHAAVQYVLGSLHGSLTPPPPPPPPSTESLSARGSLPSDVILISDDDSDTECDNGAKPSREAGKASQSAPSTATTGPSCRGKSAPRSLLDLLDDNNDDSEVPTPTAAADPVLSTSGQAETASQPERRRVVPTARDEYLDLSHATARLLTQKYTLDDVTGILNVPPRKLLDYMTNNAPYYFTPSQMTSCADCAQAGSEADALRAADVLAAGGNYRRNQLASRRTIDDGADGMAASQMDTMALTLFDRSYRVHHTDVFIPRHFAAMRPPPFLREAYPRVRDTSDDRPRRSYWPSSSSHAATDVSVDEWTEQNWREAARDRLANPALEARQVAPWSLMRQGPLAPDRDELSQSLKQGAWGTKRSRDNTNNTSNSVTPPILLPELDVLREYLPDTLNACSAVEPVVLEYAPYAQYIVLCRRLPQLAGRGVPDASPDQKPAFPTGPSASSAPRRTTFSFSSAPVQKTLSSHAARVCSELRVSILRRGLPASVPLRQPPFIMGGDSGDASDLAGGSAVGLPLLPDGDTIEDFSD